MSVGMDQQMFIVMVWAFYDGDYEFLGEQPVLAMNQTEALQPAIDELIAITNMSRSENLPLNVSFFATIKTSYRGRYFDGGDLVPDSD